MSKKGAKLGQFKFTKSDTIGAADAEDDAMLSECFIDTGDLATLTDCGDARSIVVGRTGSGKTALLKKLAETEERVINVPPESLSLTYISNSTILNFVSELGVKLDVFYKMLWRHVFTVEILKKHFQIDSEDAKRNFIQKFFDSFKGQKQRDALQYLEDWGKKFWKETEYRIKEVTSKLESDIKTNVQAKIPTFSFAIEGTAKLTEEEKGEVIQRSQEVVNRVQIRQLSEIMELIDEVLEDPQKRYFILIDRLDEDWIEDKLRYKLIRALIETVRDFRKVKYAKIIISIRQDLLDRVFRLARSSGFQEEKYESIHLRVHWSDPQLAEILDTRLNHLVQRRYTTQKISLSDLFPKSIDKQPPIQYILSRTMRQPRDVIHFVNKCISQAINKKQITAGLMKTADGEYSRDRLNYLADEWYADYPNLIKFIQILRRQPWRFSLCDFPLPKCEDFCLEYAVSFEHSTHDFLSQMACQVAYGNLSVADFMKQLFLVFYKVGVVGLKIEAYQKYIWSTGQRRSVSSSEVSDEMKIEVHPAFWRVLGIIKK